MADISTCLSPICNATAEGNVAKCPQCGWAMRSSRNIRMRGVLLLLCGVLLLGLMGAITWNMTPLLLHAGEEVDGSTFEAKPEQARMVLILFWAILAFGAVAAANGTYQIISGRKSRAMVLISLLLATAVIAYAWLTYRGLK
jgi:hypothetical protein